MEKTILVVNDDGIAAPGIRALAAAAASFGRVLVVAPDGQRSAMSHCITCNRSVEVREYPFGMDGVTAWACSGSPADCVRLGITLLGRKPDAVLSGINNGYNIAADIQYSATAGAALEAAFWGIPAIALSRDAGKSEQVQEQYLLPLLQEYLFRPLPQNQIININFPGCAPEQCRGIARDCRVSAQDFYRDTYCLEEQTADTRRYRVVPGRNWESEPGTDLYAVTHNYVSVGIVNNIH